jgi:hypothetical protein
VGVDNSAHIGGLLAGLVLGVLVPPVISGEATAESTAIAALPAQSSAEQSSRNAWRILAGSAFVLALALTQLGVKYVSVANYGKAARMARQVSQIRRSTRCSDSSRTIQNWFRPLSCSGSSS